MIRYHAHGKQVLTAAGWHIADANSTEMARRIAEALTLADDRELLRTNLESAWLSTMDDTSQPRGG